VKLLERAAPARDDGAKTLAIFGTKNEVDGLGHVAGSHIRRHL